MSTANVILHPDSWLGLPTWRYYYNDTLWSNVNLAPAFQCDCMGEGGDLMWR